MMDIAESFFAHTRKQNDFEDALCEGGLNFNGIGWDDYDCSLEIYEVPDDMRLSESLQRFIFESGFIRAYVNHSDAWETHYSWWNTGTRMPEFKVQDGHRVKYPNKKTK